MSHPRPPLRARAVILDVDGTMYAQAPVRARMAWRLACSTVAAPRRGLLTWRVLRAYRAAQEALRNGPCAAAGDEQLALAVRRSNVPAPEARACIERWMVEAPCDLLARHRRHGLLDFLAAARTAGLRIGVFSDYPCDRKLAALGARPFVDAFASAHDRGIGRFKPAPDGLLTVARALGVAPADCLYVGDRPAVDAAAADAAGMRAAVVGVRKAPAGATWAPYPDFHALADHLGLRAADAPPTRAARHPAAPPP